MGFYIDKISGKLIQKPSIKAADVTQDATHQFATNTEKSYWNNKAPGTHTHEATEINQDASHQFASDIEKNAWDSKAPGIHTHGAADVSQDATHRFATDTEKSTWDSKAPGIHTHGAADVTQDATHRFATDTEKSTWNSKADVINVLQNDFLNNFDHIMIRNKELNNIVITNETRWLVTNVDTVNKWITLNNSIPELPGLQQISVKWGLYSSYSANCDIAEVDWVNNRIRYTTIRGTISIGQGVFFFNPFLNYSMVKTTNDLLVSQASWSATYMHPAGMWLHSDGYYRMVVTGYGSDSKLRLGMVKSNDLVNWTWLNSGNYIYSGSESPFNKSWCYNLGLYMTCNPVKYGDNYLGLFAGTNMEGNWQTGWAIFNEDFVVQKVSDNPILIPGFDASQSNQGSFIKHNGNYHVFMTRRTTLSDVRSWEIYELVYKDVCFSNTLETSRLIIGSEYPGQTWHSNHVDTSVPIVYRDNLYLFVGGTGNRDNFTLMLNNRRTQGILYLDSSNNWVKYFKNPVLSAPIEGYIVWGSGYDWASGHMGGYFAYTIKDQILYVFSSFSNGSSNTYRPCGLKVALKY